MLVERFLNTPLAARPSSLGPFLSSLAFANGSYDDYGDDDDAVYSVEGAVSVVPVSGLLCKRGGGFLGTTYAQVRQAVDGAISNSSIAGIVLSIDSWGGEIGGLLDCADHVFRQRGAKPLYAVCDSAYSAGYVLASAASRVYVCSAAGVGSIGVAMAHIDQSQSDANRGLRFTYIYSGSRKIDANSHMPLSIAARANIQQETNRLRDLLCQNVARNRGVSAQRILDTQAGCLYGPAAVPLLADQVGALNDAVADMLADLGIVARQREFNQIHRLQRQLNLLRTRTDSRPIQQLRDRLAALRG